MLLLWHCFAVTKPLSQIQKSTLWPLQDANQTPSLGGFGLNGEAVDSLGEFSRGVVVKVLFDRTDAGNIVDELHGHKRTAVTDAIKVSAQDTAADRAKLEQLRSSLALHARGRPIAGQPFRLQVTLNRQPVQGAEVTVNDRALGETNERGVVAFDVPEDAEALHIVASFRNQKVELKVRVLHPDDAAGTDTNTAGSRSSTAGATTASSGASTSSSQ